MNEIYYCPFCHEILSKALIANFYLCENCDISVRSESNMPSKGVNIYDSNWVNFQNRRQDNVERAVFTLKQIKYLDGIENVLDVGCGTGILVNMLNDRGYNAEGLDSSSDAIKYAKLHRKGNYFLADLENFERPYKYDLVIANHIVEHFSNPEVFFSKTLQFLKLGGYLYIETPNLHSWEPKSFWRSRIGGMFYGIDHRTLFTNRSLLRFKKNWGLDEYRSLTRTYSTTILIAMLSTLKAMRSTSQINRSNNLGILKIGPSPINEKLARIYEFITNSWLISLFFKLPNRMSESNGRGDNLIVIFRKTS
jgi:SAM-dependent methyltransferase